MRGRYCAKFIDAGVREKIYLLSVTAENTWLVSFGLWLAGLATGIGVMGYTLKNHDLASTITYCIGLVLSGYLIYILARLYEEG